MHKHAQINCPYVRFSLRLQQEFGLRREEAIKFNVSYADQSNYIRLKGSWTKGGKPRTLPILKESQRSLLDEIRSFTRSSLIRATDRYVDQMRRYERETNKVRMIISRELGHERFSITYTYLGS